ncbi:hypothetical protein Agub_g13344, partial [Astrephomene gubernaculifera]
MAAQAEIPPEQLANIVLKSKCPFQALGVYPNSSLPDVKGAYRRLCLIFHPDKSTLPHQLASEVFQALHGAYSAATQKLQPAQRQSGPKDIWSAFYSAPDAPNEPAHQAPPPAPAAAPVRPAQAFRQGGAWGSSRSCTASAWGRPAVPPGPAVSHTVPAGSAEAPAQKGGRSSAALKGPQPGVQAPPPPRRAREVVARAEA